MQFDNEMSVTIRSLSQNEALARTVVAVFVTPLDPTLGELTDIKTAVSEAVTNAIIHGYEGKTGDIYIHCGIRGRELTVEIKDEGRGIEDIEKAREPLYTSKPEMERSGMGFTVMESFMDSILVESAPGKGVWIRMTKTLAG